MPIVNGQASSGRLVPMPFIALMSSPRSVSRSRTTIGDEHGQVHQAVGGQVEDQGVEAGLAEDHDPGKHVAGLGDARVAHQPLQRVLAEGADVADRDRDHRERGEGGVPVAGDLGEGDLEQAGEGDEGGRLGRHRHEGGDRGGRALVDVGRPLVEGGERDLEGKAGGSHRHPEQDEGVVGVAAGAEGVGDRGEVGRAGGAVEHREAVEEGRRPDRADDQVLEPGLERALALQGRSAHHVERNREELEADEEADQVLRAARGSPSPGPSRAAARRRRRGRRPRRPGSRIERIVETEAARTAIRIAARPSSSRRRAPLTRSVRSPHCQIASPAVAARAARVSPATRKRLIRGRTPAIRTTQSPAVRAMIGERPA